MERIELKRRFLLKKDGQDITLADPGTSMTTDQVMKFYAGQYPELTNCTIKGPTIDNDYQVFEFVTTVGTKG